MGQEFLIDTNVIIDTLGNKLNSKAKDFVSGLKPVVSAVTYIETLGWHNASELQLQPVKNFLSFATIIPISQQVVEKTVVIRQNKRIALGDAIIAATCLEFELILLTRNIADFRNIDGLTVINPYELQ